MTQIVFTDQTPDIDKTSTLTVITTIPPNSQNLTEKLRKVIVTLERQDIGWLDIVSAMANIAEQRGDEKVAEVLAAATSQLKRNRKVIRDL
ncbi:MAG TPA: hypothetical protein V6D14_10790 [Coleofasciculaceae cyanobacterium]|jgi:predicted ATP-grasp superfamily ATP-dependent carboligase